MSKTVRIGGAGGFLGDSAVAAAQLIEGGNVDYLVLDYLAEATMSILARAKARRQEAGYARDFTDWVWRDNLRALKNRGIRVVTNAGGINPHACRARMQELADEQGISLKVAVIDGDDLMPHLGELSAQHIEEMYSGAPFPAPDTVRSANAYFGAFPIAEALRMGADAVITGRVVDSALTLGALIHEFGWSVSDYDLLAAGSLAGHINECGAQATGGLFTDWEDVPDWAHIGYPVLECYADGSFTVTKPSGTGGLCSVGTVSEQMLYEIGDPQAYMLPDVTCDFSRVRIEREGQDRIRVSGATGRPPPKTHKVCATYQDGYRSVALLPVVGMAAARKARRQAEAVIERTQEILRAKNMAPWRATDIECIGAEESYGDQARAQDVREVACKIAVEHDDDAALDIFLREVDAPMTSMSVGTTGWFGGRPSRGPIVRLYSFTLPKPEVPAHIHCGAGERETPSAHEGPGFDVAAVERPAVAPPLPLSDDATPVRLIELAWARSGDKGDTFNIGVIARDPDYLPYIRAALSEEAVAALFAHEFEGAANPRVERFEVPGIHALNFLFHDALGGGGMASLRLDPLAKGKAQQLLEYGVPVPPEIASRIHA